MSSDETAKIEPTLTAKEPFELGSEKPSAIDLKPKSEAAKPGSGATDAKADAPALEAIRLAAKAAASKDGALKFDRAIEVPKSNVPKSDVPKSDAPRSDAPRSEAPKTDASKLEVPKSEAAHSEAPTLPPAPQIEPVVLAFKKPEPVSEPVAPAPARSTRFALLAASVAIAASFGAIGGSLGAAKLGPMISSTPAPVAPIAKEQVTEEVRALKETVVQLRANTRALSENFAALKASVATASTQNNKIAETLERIEKAQTEQRKLALSAPATVPANVTPTPAPAAASTAPQAAPETTGSIPQKQAAPMVLGTPPSNLKPPTVPGFVLRRVYDGAALIEGRDGMIEVEPGIVAPGLGRIEAIKREDGRWVVVTARGIVR